jgi:predicted DNA-binding transcriptional regulator AlpA
VAACSNYEQIFKVSTVVQSFHFTKVLVMESEIVFFTTAEVLKLLNCSKSALSNHIQRNGFPTPLKFSCGGKAPTRTTMARYPKEEVLAWLRDKSAEARVGRQPYTPTYEPVKLSPSVDIDAALYHLRGFLYGYEAHKRVLRTVLSKTSADEPYSLKWAEVRAGVMEMLPHVLCAASAVGIDVESMVRS